MFKELKESMITVNQQMRISIRRQKFKQMETDIGKCN